MNNLFAAGSDTAANTINFIIWFICKYPRVQMKLQKEIDSVVGKSRMPKYANIMNREFENLIQKICFNFYKIS